MNEESTTKNLLKSKTLWINLFMAASAFYPPVQIFMAANPQVVGLIVAGVNGILRWTTKDKLVIKSK